LLVTLFTIGYNEVVVTSKQLTALIREKLRAGAYAPGALLPAERTMALDLGASRPTLRKALEPLVNEGLLELQPGRGILVPDESARAPWRIIALLLPDFTNRFFAQVAEAIEYAALQRGYQILLCNSRHQLNLENFHIEQLIAHKIDGVILAHQPSQEIPASVELLKKAKIPTVMLFSSARESDYDSVVLDDRAGVEQALRYLVSLGHQRIAYAPPLSNSGHPRDHHFQDFMRRHFPAYTPPILNIAGKPDDAVHAAVKSLLASPAPPTACFAGNDNIAMLLMKALAQAGKSVPTQFSVVGFDNLRFVEHLPVPLTTVDQPKQEMGRRAAELLFERMEAGPGLPPRKEVFMPHLVIRDSCSVALQTSLRQPVPTRKSLYGGAK
jgi:DNA-binding LacI/PurR family transcriptional regulator